MTPQHHPPSGSRHPPPVRVWARPRARVVPPCRPRAPQWSLRHRGPGPCPRRPRRSRPRPVRPRR
ncbi:hypothetical protein C1C97_001460 [Kocuria tytonis]|uniref:Uncharacterized protein n=1 Tax=Kocuria tytonis TaxID=2054280 RepID=A0A495A8K4_9MICC|nr:hypothetical protein C1C97_001460 [Kocuria tytonis]